jgi:hypothetical protein
MSLGVISGGVGVGVAWPAIGDDLVEQLTANSARITSKPKSRKK